MYGKSIELSGDLPLMQIDATLNFPMPSWTRRIPSDVSGSDIHEFRIGWPCRALCSRHALAFFDDTTRTPYSHTALLQLTLPWDKTKMLFLPFVPLWPGFLINTLLHAALILTIRHGLLSARSTLRRRHHRCPTCNYNCRNLHSPTCPECGKPHGIPVPPSTQPTSTT